jgi:hypothetical protein
LVAHPAAPQKASGSLKPTAKVSDNVSVPAALTEAAKLRTLSDLLVDVSEPLNDAPVGNTSIAQVEKEISSQGKGSEKAEALADSLEAHYQPVNDPSEQAVIKTVNETMHA